MEAQMTRLQEKAQGRTKQVAGQIIGDDKLVLEGKAEERRAEEAEEKAKSKNPEARGRGREWP
jgi:uncharacterized protein YjbJ (UPF0337 family)